MTAREAKRAMKEKFRLRARHGALSFDDARLGASWTVAASNAIKGRKRAARDNGLPPGGRSIYLTAAHNPCSNFDELLTALKAMAGDSP